MTRRLTAEFVGTAFLVATIVGSGIAGDRLSDSTGLALAINAIAVGAVLVALILAFATFGLLAVIFGCARALRPATSVAFAVGAYITAAFFFTASTSFANPAVTLGRVFTETFAGIDPQSAVAFFPAQLVGAALGAGLLWYLYPDMPETAERATIPRDELREEPDLAASTRAR